MKAVNAHQPSSFHGDTITTTPAKLIALAKKLGASYYDGNDGEDKTNFDFSFQTDSGTYFTVYDWKEYRKLNVNNPVEFHVGHAGGNRVEIMNELRGAL